MNSHIMMVIQIQEVLGHIGITVPDVYEACERFESLGVDFQKKPDDGNMKGLAFIKDPDGYWIENFYHQRAWRAQYKKNYLKRKKNVSIRFI